MHRVESDVGLRGAATVAAAFAVTAAPASAIASTSAAIAPLATDTTAAVVSLVLGAAYVALAVALGHFGMASATNQSSCGVRCSSVARRRFHTNLWALQAVRVPQRDDFGGRCYRELGVLLTALTD